MKGGTKTRTCGHIAELVVLLAAPVKFARVYRNLNHIVHDSLREALGHVCRRRPDEKTSTVSKVKVQCKAIGASAIPLIISSCTRYVCFLLLLFTRYGCDLLLLYVSSYSLCMFPTTAIHVSSYCCVRLSHVCTLTYNME